MTEEFLSLAKSTAKARGYADIPMVVLPHPFETRSVDEVERIAQEKAHELVEKLVAPRVAARH